jgi:phosphopantothenoylcysteine decarboxylase/phosphopantothenate--cysteine ligase
MNTAMYNNPVTQKNIGILKELGYKIIEPASGLLACGDTGAGKMPEPEELFDHIRYHLAGPKDMLGKKVIVTAGPTQEAIDPVRYITNHSSGKMGYALAQAAMLRGADVTLVSGQTSLTPPRFVKVIDVTSTQSMYDAVVSNFDDADYVFKAAAVSDYTPAETYDDKVKKKDGDMSIPLKRTPDILMELGRRKKEGQYLCGFSMETRDLMENSSVKLEKKNADMIVANNLKDKGSGFKTDTNMITLITKDDVRPLPLMSKFDAANAIIDAVLDSQKGDRSE